MWSQYKRFLWQIHWLLKQTSLASGEKRAGRNCLARGIPMAAGSLLAVPPHCSPTGSLGWKLPEDKAWMCILSHLEGDSTQKYRWATRLPGCRTPGAGGPQGALLLRRTEPSGGRVSTMTSEMWGGKGHLVGCHWLQLTALNSFE